MKFNIGKYNIEITKNKEAFSEGGSIEFNSTGNLKNDIRVMEATERINTLNNEIIINAKDMDKVEEITRTSVLSIHDIRLFINNFNRLPTKEEIIMSNKYGFIKVYTNILLRKRQAAFRCNPPYTNKHITDTVPITTTVREDTTMKNDMKVYISLPISGFPLPMVKKRAETYKKELIANGYEVITPFDVCDEPDKTYAYYMGKDIEALLECDAIYLAPGWHGSKGCMAEYEIAKVYDKKIIV